MAIDVAEIILWGNSIGAVVWDNDKACASFEYSQERLCYIGSRGMGALEFKPTIGQRNRFSSSVDIAHLVELANKALAQKESLSTHFGEDEVIVIGYLNLMVFTKIKIKNCLIRKDMEK